MRKKNRFIMIFAFIFLGCATDIDKIGQGSNFPYTDLSHINLPQGEQRFIEETIGISLVIPRAWRTTSLPGIEATSLRGPTENGFTPLMVFSVDDNFDGQLYVMIDLFLEELATIHGENFKLISRSNFATINGLEGEMLVVILTLHEFQQRQVIFCLPGEGKKTILLFCLISAEAEDAFDKRFYRIVETFEWLP